ncbi:MAG: M20 family metallopeptidase [Desulfobulbaceae bacterium]|nr:M20 family metallopeptidase [Desulfobulbaceae bacterium]
MVGSDSKISAWMRELRHTLHRFPELAYEEKKTAGLIAEQLSRLGIPHISGIAGTGIVGLIEGPPANTGPDACVALRADMDGIPLQEETGLPYASTNPGIMHACGHDGHMAMLLGAAALLQRERPPGKVKLLFQPAEEAGRGARKMIREWALDGVGMIFGGHIDIHFPAGTITVDSGLICSYTDPFTITIRGRGGHAAWPHEAIDSVVVAANLIMTLQTLVSREVDPVYPAVVTVGRVQAGTVHNVIADKAVIDGTIRSAHPETRQKILRGLQRIIQGTAAMSGADISLQLHDGLPALINEEGAAAIARRAAVDIVGEEQVVSQGRPSLGGEDFAFYLHEIPGCMVRFGADREENHPGPAHSSRFDFNEDALAIGASWLARVAVCGLERMAAGEPSWR